MRGSVTSVSSVLLIFLISNCVDRINIDIGLPAAYPVVIDGFISDQHGPYLIKVSKAYDIESKSSLRVPISVKRLTISDNLGNSETLSQGSIGYYYTSFFGIRGVVGRVYTLRVELLDDRMYLSNPDTLNPSGTVDKVYFQFRSDLQDNGVINYGFDVFFDSSGGGRDKFHFLWKFNGTYKATITCCTCYVPLSNPEPLVSDGQLVQEGHFLGVKAAYVPVTGYTFMFKVHAEVDQMSLSNQAFEFWRAVRSQLTATNSLFQPITGKVPGNFFQLKGPPSPLQGIFYSTSISSNAVFITPADVPNQNFIPPLQLAPEIGNFIVPQRCTDEFPNSTSARPPYWVD